MCPGRAYPKQVIRKAYVGQPAAKSNMGERCIGHIVQESRRLRGIMGPCNWNSLLEHRMSLHLGGKVSELIQEVERD